MIDKSRFLITGLPRTRTTWLTVLFNCICVEAAHERDLFFDSMNDLTEWLEGGTEKHPHGLIDGFASCAYPSYALKTFANNPIVFIKRSVKDVQRSWEEWQGYPTHQGLLYLAQKNYKRFLDEAPSQALIVNYEDLDDYKTCKKIVETCTNRTLPKSTFHFLNHVQVELHWDKCATFTRANPKPYILEVENA